VDWLALVVFCLVGTVVVEAMGLVGGRWGRGRRVGCDWLGVAFCLLLLPCKCCNPDPDRHPRTPPVEPSTPNTQEPPAPAPNTPISILQEPGGDFAAVVFNGVATPRACREAEEKLRAALLRDGLRPRAGYWLARYNDPGVKPAQRRNEVLVALEPGSFDLWG